MDTAAPHQASLSRHYGPHPGFVAIAYCALFLAGLYHVISFTGGPHFPGPWETPEVISRYFHDYPTNVVWCAALEFGAAIPLGIYTATVVSRLHYLGVRAAGAHIALYGGFLASIFIMISAAILWVMASPGVAYTDGVVFALYYLSFICGGVGLSVPLGLLIAGLAITSAFTKLLPRWMVISGIIIAICGELSWLDLLTPKALALIPLTRFPGFIWLILVGFMLPVSQGSSSKSLRVS